MEKWVSVKDADNYEISNYGNLRNKNTNLILKKKLDKYGYLVVSYIDNYGIKRYRTIHRLVAENWIETDSILLQVNHKDGIKSNNYYTNLEWVTPSQNIIHSYKTLLNSNTRHVELFNLETKEKTEFRSIKSLGKYLNISPSTLVPLILNSKINPILDKYVITLNEDIIKVIPNVSNFGKKIFVYDYINQKLEEYNSILIAAYYTGVRSLSEPSRINNNYFQIGYCFSFDKNKIPINIKVDKEKLLKERNYYLLKPYRNISKIKYYLYNYYTSQEIMFNTLDDMCEYLNKIEPYNFIVDKRHITNALQHCNKANKTSIIKGFGLKSSLYDYEWFPYDEEIIICNLHRKPAPTRTFRVILNNKESLVIGIYNLCKMFNFVSNKNINLVNEKDILKYCNNPNLSITRLNKPIKCKESDIVSSI